VEKVKATTEQARLEHLCAVKDSLRNCVENYSGHSLWEYRPPWFLFNIVQDCFGYGFGWYCGLVYVNVSYAELLAEFVTLSDMFADHDDGDVT
jgi:hypothetical protein